MTTRATRPRRAGPPGGTAAEGAGSRGRFHWPSVAWTKASYSCYKPGQWTTLAGSEGAPVGSIFFAGQHRSYEFQGYMNGAAQSGADAAASIARALGIAKAAGVRRPQPHRMAVS